MKRLIGYEMKKLCSRRMVWVALALAMTLLITGNAINMVQDRLGGRVQGIRDVYARYEGRILTDAIAAQAWTELESYIAQHPDEFVSYDSDNEDSFNYFPVGYHDYAGGLWEGYIRLAQGWTVENQRDMRIRIEKMVNTGLDEDGKHLSQQHLDSYISYLAKDDIPPVITYFEGYAQLYNYGQITGIITVFLVLLLTAWLFPVEQSARMESVALTTSQRRRCALSKMVVGALCALLAFVLFFGAELLAAALTYGLDGFGAPAGAVNAGWSEGTIGQAFTGRLALSLTAAVATAALMTLLSAILRRSAVVLLTGGLATAIQVIAQQIASGYMDMPSLRDFFNTAAGEVLQRIFTLLPAAALWSNGNLFYLGSRPGPVLLGLGISALITALSLWLAPRLWLRQRRT